MIRSLVFGRSGRGIGGGLFEEGVDAEGGGGGGLVKESYYVEGFVLGKMLVLGFFMDRGDLGWLGAAWTYETEHFEDVVVQLLELRCLKEKE